MPWVSRETLRPASASDVAAIEELVRAAYGHYLERLGGPPRPMTDDYAAVVRDADATVAEREGRVVGLLVLRETDEGFLLDNIAVHPGSQGGGLGGRLLDLAEERARDAGYGSIYLYTHETMAENQAIYTGRGYVEYDRRGAPTAGGSIVFLRKALLP